MSSTGKYILIILAVGVIVYLWTQNAHLKDQVAELEADNEDRQNQRPLENLTVSAPIEPAWSYSTAPIESMAVETTPAMVPAVGVPEAIEEAQAPEPVPEPGTESVPDFRHSDDFTTVYKGGERYTRRVKKFTRSSLPVKALFRLCFLRGDRSLKGSLNAISS